MSKSLVTDELWALVEPLLPHEPPKPKGGRPRVPNKAALMGILFVLKSGIPWQMLPQEMGCGSGMTCWRRLKEWHEAGVWNRLRKTMLDRLAKADEIDWKRASLDSASVPAPGGAKRRGPIRRTRTNRARSVTFWSTGGASHSLLSTPPPTSMTLRRWRRPWTPSRRSVGLVAAHVNAPRSCIPTRGTTSRAAENRSGRGA